MTWTHPKLRKVSLGANTETNLGAHEVGMSVFLELQHLHTLSRAIVVPANEFHAGCFEGRGDGRIHLVTVPVSLVYLA